LTGSVEEENVVKEDRDRVQAAAELRALMEGGADPGGAGDGAVDSASSEESLIDKHLRHDDGKSIDHDAGGGQLVQAAGDRPSAQAVATGREGGGGVGGLDASKYPMGSRDGDMQANGSSDAWDGRCEHGVPYKQCGSCFDIPEAVVQKNARRAQEGGGVA
jgi:hypothetical protein